MRRPYPACPPGARLPLLSLGTVHGDLLLVGVESEHPSGSDETLQSWAGAGNESRLGWMGGSGG